MPLHALKHLDNLKNHATANTRKTTFTKMKTLLKQHAPGKENKALASIDMASDTSISVEPVRYARKTCGKWYLMQIRK